MRLSIIFFISLLAATFSLTCEEDIRCCRILKAEIYSKKLDSVQQLSLTSHFFWTEAISHHFLQLTLSNEETAFMELSGDTNEKKDARCYLKASDDFIFPRLYGRINLTMVENGMTAGRLYQHCVSFYENKTYGLTAHTFLGTKSNENCITVAQYLWKKLADNNLRDVDYAVCDDD